MSLGRSLLGNRLVHLVPNSFGTLREYNDCHEPAGSPIGGRFCSTTGGKMPASPPGWKPQMTRSEAYDWVQQTGGLFHAGQVVVSSRKKADAIAREGFSTKHSTTGRVWGEGVYIGLGFDSEQYYTKMKFARTNDPTVLEVVANLKNPLTLRIPNEVAAKWYDTASDMASIKGLATALGWSESTFTVPDKPMKYGELAMALIRDQTAHLKRQGYDSLVIIAERGYVGLRPLFSPGVTSENINATAGWGIIGGQQIVVFDPKRVTVTKVRAPLKSGD